MLIDLPYGFVEGPHFASDIARVAFSESAQDELLGALQAVLLWGDAVEASNPLRGSLDIRYVKTRDFPWLDMPESYLTFRFERADLIELRRIVTEEDVRAGVLPDLY